jgi:hypothetical protein
LSEHINHARYRELITAHDRGHFSYVFPKRTPHGKRKTGFLPLFADYLSNRLWDRPEEWDAEVICGGMVWHLHRRILCRDSDWFRDRLSPIMTNINHVCKQTTPDEFRTRRLTPHPVH